MYGITLDYNYSSGSHFIAHAPASGAVYAASGTGYYYNDWITGFGYYGLYKEHGQILSLADIQAVATIPAAMASTMANWSITGWYLKSDGAPKASGTFGFGITPIYGDLTLYANWNQTAVPAGINVSLDVGIDPGSKLDINNGIAVTVSRDILLGSGLVINLNTNSIANIDATSIRWMYNGSELSDFNGSKSFTMQGAVYSVLGNKEFTVEFSIYGEVYSGKFKVLVTQN